MPRWVKSWLGFLRRQKRAPEHSVGLRVAVALNVGAAIIATAAQLQWDANALTCLVVTGLAMAFSHGVRHRNNWEVKALLSVSMLFALLVFFDHLARSTNDPRVPLAELLLWLQTLHSFDLPGRKDLSYSLLVAVTLISIAAVLSVEMSFGFYLAIYLLTAVAALYWNGLAAVRELVPYRPARGAAAPPLSLLVRLGAAALLCLALMPHYQSFKLRSLPVDWQRQFRQQKISGGLLHNSAFPSTDNPQDFRRRARFNPDSYAGFNSVVDLQLRGQMSSEVVIRARVSAFAYYRALAFVHYDGQFWTRDKAKPQTLVTDFPPMNIPCDVPDENSEEVVQIFYVDKGLPNVVLSASSPFSLYFPSQQIFFDRDHDMISPYELSEGTVYSVISRRQNLSAAKLREFKRPDRTWRTLGAYRELPSSLPTRVGKLAHQIADGEDSPYGKALALTNYLQSHYVYDLNVARYAEDHDVADSFLFEAKRGYCEEFATALAVMGRTVGLATRYVTGYLPGRYNPLTGYQEIEARDAHAWVEVYLPGYGWASFDPTPGGTGSLEAEVQADHSRWIIGEYGRYLVAALGPHARTLLRLTVAAMLALLGALALRARGRHPLPVGPREEVRGLYARALVELERRGQHRETGTSPRAFAAGVGSSAFALLTALHERAVYAGDCGLVQEARDALAELCEESARVSGKLRT